MQSANSGGTLQPELGIAQALPQMQVSQEQLQGMLKAAVTESIQAVLHGQVDRSIGQMREEMARRVQDDQKLEHQMSELFKSVADLKQAVRHQEDGTVCTESERHADKVANFEELSAKSEDIPSAGTEELFRKIDIDRDGVISHEEFFLALRAGVIEPASEQVSPRA